MERSAGWTAVLISGRGRDCRRRSDLLNEIRDPVVRDLTLLLTVSLKMGIFRSPMKLALSIFWMICLQVAISPLCLCLGAQAGAAEAGAAEAGAEAKPACCHAPASEEPAPCPHCDQEMPIAATAPVKGDFAADAPEWEGFAFFFATEWSETSPLAFPEARAEGAVSQSLPPPPSFQVLYRVLLI